MHSNKQNLLPTPESKYKHKAVTFGQIILIPFKLLPYFLMLALFFIILIGIFAGISVAPYYASLKTAYADGMTGQDHLVAAESSIKEQDFDQAVNNLEAAEQDFKSAKNALSIAGKAAIFRSDLLKNQLMVASEIVEIGEISSRSLKEITQIGQQVKKVLHTETLSWETISTEEKGKILSILNNSVDQLEKTQEDLSNVNQKLISIKKKQPLFIFDQVIEPLQAKLPAVRRSFDNVIVVAKLLPAFSGYPTEKTYLLILENNREMRPSGGFIGTYGIVKIKNAELVSFFTEDSYQLDKQVEADWDIESPEPMAKYMNQPHWYFRDANWWPDWPTSAEKIKWFYEQEGGEEKVDGVIAITPTVLEEFLGVLGNFTVSDLLFNKANFWEQLEYQVEYGYNQQGIEMKDRKDIIGDLGKMVIDKLHSLPMNKLSELIDITTGLVEQKHIQLYFIDPQMQSLALENEWAGEVKSTDGDFVMLVDANLAALKTDSVMERTLLYHLNQSDSKNITAKAEVTYQNLGTFSWKTTRYRTYTRLYVPAGSELISIKVGNKIIDAEDIDTVDEFGKTSFGLFFEVEPQTSKKVTWEYQLPTTVTEKVGSGEYSLLVQKQAGLPSMNVQLDLNFNKSILSQDALAPNRQSLQHVEVINKDQFYTVWFQ
jgi:hypothetical protein